MPTTATSARRTGAETVAGDSTSAVAASANTRPLPTMSR
jgi:hypothetical protein